MFSPRSDLLDLYNNRSILCKLCLRLYGAIQLSPHTAVNRIHYIYVNKPLYEASVFGKTWPSNISKQLRLTRDETHCQFQKLTARIISSFPFSEKCCCARIVAVSSGFRCFLINYVSLRRVTPVENFISCKYYF